MKIFKVTYEHPIFGPSEIVISLDKGTEEEAKKSIFLRFNEEFLILNVEELFW